MDDETIKVAKKFLEEHPEEIKKLASKGASIADPGYRVISKFLGENLWSESRIRYSLEHLKLKEFLIKYAFFIF